MMNLLVVRDIDYYFGYWVGYGVVDCKEFNILFKCVMSIVIFLCGIM